ncbi:MAG: DUF6545 domain-containing protein [Pseudonocardiaceae bacterium]
MGLSPCSVRLTPRPARAVIRTTSGARVGSGRLRRSTTATASRHWRAAQQFAAARQIPRADLDAAVAACWLETARQATLAGKRPRSTVCDITSPGGTNLREEIEFLLTVARFHAGPLAAEFVEFAAHHPAEVA